MPLGVIATSGSWLQESGGYGVAAAPGESPPSWSSPCPGSRNLIISKLTPRLLTSSRQTRPRGKSMAHRGHLAGFQSSEARG
jgi:hypothetical protein